MQNECGRMQSDVDASEVIFLPDHFWAILNGRRACQDRGGRRSEEIVSGSRSI
jgi:hypothetical protein